MNAFKGHVGCLLCKKTNSEQFKGDETRTIVEDEVLLPAPHVQI